MAQTILAQFPVTNFTGTRNIPQTTISDATATEAVLQLDGTTMLDPSVQVTLETEVSTDGGVTYPWKSSAAVQGGSIDRHGNPVAVYDIASALPADTGSGRLLRGTVTVTGSLTTTVTAYTA